MNYGLELFSFFSFARSFVRSFFFLERETCHLNGPAFKKKEAGGVTFSRVRLFTPAGPWGIGGGVRFIRSFICVFDTCFFFSYILSTGYLHFFFSISRSRKEDDISDEDEALLNELDREEEEEEEGDKEVDGSIRELRQRKDELTQKHLDQQRRKEQLRVKRHSRCPPV